ncbi:MAG: hypothetical protein WC663_02705 [Patescibacteria group bacterium]|jgi:hypothetical protein
MEGQMKNEWQVGQGVIIRISEHGEEKHLLDAYVYNLYPLSFKVASKGIYAGRIFESMQCEFICLGQKELHIYWFRKSTGTDMPKPGEVFEMPRHYIYGILAFCEVTAWECLAKGLDSTASLESFKQDYKLVEITSLSKEGMIFYNSNGPVALFSIADEPCRNLIQLRLR